MPFSAEHFLLTVYEWKFCHKTMLLRILTFFKWVYGNPLTFLVGIRRIPAYHVDYTTALLSHAAAMYRSATKGSLWQAGSVWARRASQQRCVKSHMGRVDGAVHHVIDRMTNWLTLLREVLSYPSSLLSQTLSSSCFTSTNSATTNTLYDDVMSSIFNWKGKNLIYLSKIFHLQTILGCTNINYLHEKSMDSSMIDWLKQTVRLTYLKKRKWLHSLPQPTLNMVCLKLASGVMLVSRPEGWTSPRITAFQADCSI